MSGENTNWGQSVGGVVIKDNKVLLVRHTYGSANGKLVIPGGFVLHGEAPTDALKREFLEETGAQVEPKEILAIRFNTHEWYVVFSAEYIGGTLAPDNDEISEVLWVDIEQALAMENVPNTSKVLIKSAVSGGSGLTQIPYEGKNAPCSLYLVK